MCGIIGISSNKSVSASIINSLKKLEYRGYDSAGIATLSENIISEVKSEGRVENLEKNFDCVKRPRSPEATEVIMCRQCMQNSGSSARCRSFIKYSTSSRCFYLACIF